MPALIPIAAAGVAFISGATVFDKFKGKEKRSLLALLEKAPVDNQQSDSNHQMLEVATQAITYGRTMVNTLLTRVTNLEEHYQLFIKTQVDPLFDTARDEQLKKLAQSTEITLTPYEREINHGLALSGIITTAAIVTIPFAPLLRLGLCLPPVVYLMKEQYKLAYQALVYERRLSFSLLNAVYQTLLWSGGYYVIGGLLFILGSLGQKLSYITEDRSQKGLVNIFGQQPHAVWVINEGVEIEIPFAQLQVGDTLVINAGQMVPTDGVIVAGHAALDQHRLTGESHPAEKGVGDTVLAATMVVAGRIQVRVEKTGQETVAAQIGEMLNRTASYQMAITTKAAQISDDSLLPTFLMAGLAGLTIGYQAMVAITSTMMGLSLRISGPVALLNYLNTAARYRILIKDGRSLELLQTIDTIVFDKTGTLTLEQPHVTQVHTFASVSGRTVLTYAAAVEQRQEHPVARAILAAAQDQGIALPAIKDARYEIGYGIQAWLDDNLIQVGSDRFMALAEIPLTAELEVLQTACQAQGHSLVIVAVDGQVVGAIELEPTLRPEIQAVLAELRQRNLDLYIISGDQEEPTRKLAQTLDIQHYFANTLPENKAKLVEQLQQEGRAVCFVGDGINDSIALKKANVSISLSGATTVATDTAQIVLMDTTLKQLPTLFKLAQEMDDNLKTGLSIAVVPVLLIWGGVFFLHLGILGAATLFEISLWAGIGNAMRPLLLHRAEAGE